jgi:hypothetical protein
MSESTTYLAVHEDDQRVVVTTDQLASVCRDEIIKVVPDLPDYRETSYRDLG